MAEVPSTPPYERREVVVSVGPGGVGKTTCAAAMALAAARAGKRVVVVTIDPSRRLAQALGVDQSQHEPGTVVAVEHRDAQDPAGGPGSLDALLLDPKDVFDGIVRECASSPEAGARLLHNRIYRATSEHLGGALEYAAMARLQMLHASGDYDLIVLDTPPTANAVEFLGAPRRIRELIDNPAAKVFLGGGRLGGTILNLGANVFMRALRTIGGADFIGELADFLREFSDVVSEFQRRGGSFEELLTSSRTGVVLTTAPTEFSVREGVEFLRVLQEQGLHVDGVVLNRMEPSLPEAPPVDAVAARLAEATKPEVAQELAAHARAAYEDARAQGERARQAKANLAKAFPGLRLWVAARRSPPPDGLEDLRALGDELFGAAHAVD